LEFISHLEKELDEIDCPLCDEDYFAYSELEQHLRGCMEMEFICKYCLFKIKREEQNLHICEKVNDKLLSYM
jgi:C4-type Zn-finger protein